MDRNQLRQLLLAEIDSILNGPWLLSLSVLTMVAIGAGSDLTIEDGYYPQVGWKFVSIHRRVIVIGEYEGMLVCVDKGDEPPYDGFYLIDRNGWQERVVTIHRVVGGELQHIVPNLGFQKSKFKDW